MILERTRNGKYVDEPFYYFSSGTVTVTANKIEMDVKSHFGSTLKLTYTGDMTVKSGAPQKAMSPMKSHNVLNF